MIIRNATFYDNEQLIELTALTPMAGIISLRIDRKPDFFLLLKKRGEYKVIVAEKDNRVIGSISCTVQPTVICNKEYPVYYIGDLKVHPDFTGTPIVYRIVKSMLEELKRMGADILFCTAAEGNKAVQAIFEGRMSLPPFTKTGYFKIHQLLPKRSSNTYPFIETTRDSNELLSFYNNFYSRFSFYPAISDTEECTHYIYREHNEINAAASVYNPLSLKQNVVINYPFFTGIILRSLSWLKKILPLPAVLQKGKPVRVLYIRYFGYQPCQEEKFQVILKKIRNDAYQNGFHFVSFTVHEKDMAVERLIKPQSTFTFLSLGFITSLNNNSSLLKSIITGIPFEDYSLV